MQIYLNILERETLKKIHSYLFENMEWDEQINFLFEKFFNPKTMQKNIFANIELLPDANEYDSDILNSLDKKGLIEILQKNNKVIPLPLSVLVNCNKESISTEKIQYLLEKYHEKTSFKLHTTISKFGVTDRALTIKEIAPLIFLLYNNNISKIHGKFSPNMELKRTIDRINYAFVDKDPNTLGTKDQDAALSGWYLAQANNKLGLPILNKKSENIPYYYIKTHRVKDIENAILKTIEKDKFSALKSLAAFEAAFEKHSRILFKFGVYYSTENSKERIRNLFRRINQNEC